MNTSDVLLWCGIVAGGIFAYCAFLMFVGLRLNKLGLVAAVFSTVALLVAIVFGLGLGPSPPLILFLTLAFGWLLYAYLRYKQVRQDELLQIIAAAIEANLPLGPAIRAYVAERPPDARKADWVAALFLLCPPGFWLWHQRLRFDHKVAELAHLLDHGARLPDALTMVRGIASREVKVAASVGETTGRLAECLRKADRDRLAGAWLEILPRLLYPFVVLVFVAGITTFLMMVVVPRFKRIFDDFGYPLPDLTQRLIDFSAQFESGGQLVVLAVPAAFVWAAAMFLSPTVRWYLPIVGRLYRWEAQGLVLRMLGALIEVGQTVPAALSLLADAGDLPYVVRRCLWSARDAVERGEPLADALRGAGLLPKSMVPLVLTSERTGALPWALAELGNHLAGRAVSTVRRFSYVASPTLVVAIGLLVAFIVVGMFLPLVDVMGRLSV